MHHKRTPSSKTALTSAKAKSMRHIPLTTPCDTYVELKVTNRFKRLTTAYKYNAHIDQHWNQTHGKKKKNMFHEKKKKKNEQPCALNVHTYYNTVTRYIFRCAQ